MNPIIYIIPGVFEMVMTALEYAVPFVRKAQISAWLDKTSEKICNVRGNSAAIFPLSVTKRSGLIPLPRVKFWHLVGLGLIHEVNVLDHPKTQQNQQGMV